MLTKANPFPTHKSEIIHYHLADVSSDEADTKPFLIFINDIKMIMNVMKP